MHAAGIEISRPLPKKEPREYDLVFDVKTSGWHALWPVSYTHLDVYKRQHWDLERDENLQLREFPTLNHVCLLYTSRCV